MKIVIVCLSIFLVAAGCYQAHSDDDLRCIPVTNNPNLIPKSRSDGIPY